MPRRSIAIAVPVLLALCWMPTGAVLGEEAATSAPKALATDEYNPGGLEVHLIELRRTSGDTVTAKWLYRNTTESEVTVQNLISPSTYLVDPAAKKKYFCVKDSEGDWVAGKFHDNRGEVKAGQTFKMWAKFPAPPAATEKLTVYINGVAPLEDVPLAK